MGAPAPDSGCQRAWLRLSICTRGFLLGTRLQSMYYNFLSQNPWALETHPETRGHSMADTLSKPASTRNPPGAGAVFHPRVRVFTRQHFGAGQVFGQPTTLPSLRERGELKRHSLRILSLSPFPTSSHACANCSTCGNPTLTSAMTLTSSRSSSRCDDGDDGDGGRRGDAEELQ
jgi:hypothetical protein